MPGHLHLVLGLDTGEIEHLALPVPGGTSGSIDLVRNVPLIGWKDGVNKIFTTPDKFVRVPFTEVVYYNGVAQEEGVGSDYVVSESVPGTGYDTVTFWIAPLPWEKLTIDYLKHP